MSELIKEKKKSEILAEKIASMPYGDVIYHSEIAEVIQEPVNTSKYYGTITKAKKILLKQYGKAIENIRDDGYRVVNPDDFVNISLGHYKKGFNEIQKATDTLTYAPVKAMSEEGRETYRRFNDRAIMLHASMSGIKTELKMLGEKKHPFIAALK